MAQNVSITQHFTYTVNGVVYTGGSTTTPVTLSVGGKEVFDRTYVIGSGTSNVQEILSCGSDATDNITNFDYLFITSDKDAFVQLLCDESGAWDDGTPGHQNAFVLKLTANIPLILSSDYARNLDDLSGTFNEANYDSEIDTWELDWAVGVIDRVEYYHAAGGDAVVRVVAFT
tara:strand:+ start:539 stop:1057 length:519 start_codon:yes stop_codon:yes gene_type:complete